MTGHPSSLYPFRARMTSALMLCICHLMLLVAPLEVIPQSRCTLQVQHSARLERLYGQASDRAMARLPPHRPESWDITRCSLYTWCKDHKDLGFDIHSQTLLTWELYGMGHHKSKSNSGARPSINTKRMPHLLLAAEGLVHKGGVNPELSFFPHHTVSGVHTVVSRPRQNNAATRFSNTNSYPRPT